MRAPLEAVDYLRIEAAPLSPSSSDHRVQMDPVPTGERSTQSLQHGAASPWRSTTLPAALPALSACFTVLKSSTQVQDQG